MDNGVLSIGRAKLAFLSAFAVAVIDVARTLRPGPGVIRVMKSLRSSRPITSRPRHASWWPGFSGPGRIPTPWRGRWPPRQSGLTPNSEKKTGQPRPGTTLTSVYRIGGLICRRDAPALRRRSVSNVSRLKEGNCDKWGASGDLAFLIDLVADIPHPFPPPPHPTQAGTVTPTHSHP